MQNTPAFSLSLQHASGSSCWSQESGAGVVVGSGVVVVDVGVAKEN